MKSFLSAAWIVLLAGCIYREPNYSNYGRRPHEWSLPGPDYEKKVFGPMVFTEVKEFIVDRQSEGWELVGYEQASIPENEMINTIELDRPIDRKAPESKDVPKKNWTFDLPKAYDDGVYAPAPKAVAAVGAVRPTGGFVDSVPPYLDEGVKPYRQQYLVIMRRWK